MPKARQLQSTETAIYNANKKNTENIIHSNANKKSKGKLTLKRIF